MAFLQLVTEVNSNYRKVYCLNSICYFHYLLSIFQTVMWNNFILNAINQWKLNGKCNDSIHIDGIGSNYKDKSCGYWNVQLKAVALLE